MAAKKRDSTLGLIVQIAVSTALVGVMGWLYLGPKHVALGSFELMLYFGFFPAFVIYRCVGLRRRFAEQRREGREGR